MDYILVAFLAAEKTTLSYAVGEWAKVWPLQALIRSMGAFFVRRKSGNPLYRLVLERYIHMATKEGVCQAVFLEGGLTRDGLLRPPKLGFIDYMLRSFKPGNDRDIIFIPVGINYDRTLEDRSLLRMLNPDAVKRSRWFIMKTTIRFVWRSIIFILLSRWQRFGYASVNFGQRISAREYCRLNDIDFSKMKRKDRFGEVEKISGHIMASIQNVIPVLPVPLVAAVFVKFPDDLLSAFDVEAHANRIIDEMQAKNAPVFLSTTSRVQTIVTALNMLRIRRLVIETDGSYKADPEMLNILSYYANSIDHYFPNG
jgi:glycerol-3-phosphate O-acyltransferase